MKQRLPYFGLLVVSLVIWWFSDHIVVPWLEHISGYDVIENHDLSVLLGHWVFGQLPRVILCLAVWMVGSKFGLMPLLRQSLGQGSSWRTVIRTGLISSGLLVLITVVVGAVGGGTFGFHPYFTKMAGDVVSNMYEEIVYRGLMFCAFYSAAAGLCFPLDGSLKTAGVIGGTVGSSLVFAIGHDQYSVALRVVIGIVSIAFVYPWIKSRSLWAPWIAHTVGDIVGDTIVTL